MLGRPEVRLLARLALVTAVAALPAAIALASCGTDAEGPDACRQIEEARCALAPTCSPGFDVQSCELFYRDECLVGLQNNAIGEPPQTTVGACVTALDQITACASGVDGGDGGCPGLGILVEMDASCNGPDGGPIEVTPCNVLLNCPEVLYACAFIAAVPGADAGDAGDATGTGGSPVFTTSTSSSSTAATGTGGAASTSSTAASTTSTGTGGASGTGGSGTGGMDASSD